MELIRVSYDASATGTREISGLVEGATYFSSVKSFNYFKSLGMKISRVTILKFLEYTESVFLANLLEQ